jgi:hypothetical protein
MQQRGSIINAQIVCMHVCADCNAFFAYNIDRLVTYYFVCTEINENPEGNYIVEVDPNNKTTTVKFLPMEEKKDMQTVYHFDSLLPLTPQNVLKKIKTYIIFS